MIINLKTSPEYLWVFWPFAGLGMGIISRRLKLLGFLNLSAAKKVDRKGTSQGKIPPKNGRKHINATKSAGQPKRTVANYIP
jgi:hypothetical protein